MNLTQETTHQFGRYRNQFLSISLRKYRDQELRGELTGLKTDNRELAFPQTRATRARALRITACLRGRIRAKAALSNPYAARTPKAMEPTDTAINITKFTRSVIFAALAHLFWILELSRPLASFRHKSPRPRQILPRFSQKSTQSSHRCLLTNVMPDPNRASIPGTGPFWNSTLTPINTLPADSSLDRPHLILLQKTRRCIGYVSWIK